MNDDITITKVITCRDCNKPKTQEQMAKKDAKRFKTICKACDSIRRQVRKATGPKPYTLEWTIEAYGTPSDPSYDRHGNPLDRIQFTNGDAWTAVGSQHLAMLAALPSIPEGVRIHLAAMSKLTPGMFATFEPGELARMIGIDSKNLARALKSAVSMGLTDPLSTTRKVWVCPDEAQRKYSDQGCSDEEYESKYYPTSYERESF